MSEVLAAAYVNWHPGYSGRGEEESEEGGGKDLPEE